jgi:hypothetical protein
MGLGLNRENGTMEHVKHTAKERKTINHAWSHLKLACRQHDLTCRPMAIGAADRLEQAFAIRRRESGSVAEARGAVITGVLVGVRNPLSLGDLVSYTNGDIIAAVLGAKLRNIDGPHWPELDKGMAAHEAWLTRELESMVA